MRADGCDGALEEEGGVGFADEVYQHAIYCDDDASEIEWPAPVLHIRQSFPPPRAFEESRENYQLRALAT